MKRQSLAIFLVSVALVAVTAAMIAHRKTHQRLGAPGVKVIAKPIYDTEGKLAGTNSVDLPENVLNFTSEPQPMEKIVLDWLPKDTTFGQRMYKSSEGAQVSMSVVLMGADRTSIHKPEYCLKGTGWEIQRQEFDEIPLRDGLGKLPVRKMSVRRSGKLPSGQEIDLRGFYVYWFVADGQITANHNERFLLMAWDMISSGVLQRWAYVSCLAVCRPGEEETAYRRLREFIGESAPQIQTAKPVTRLATGPF